MRFGPGESRFVEEKRHYAKPIPVNDLVLLDRERCILCDRCVRFAKEVAGDPLLVFTERGNSTQVLTFPDHPFSSYFSGNTVQICPVGALTAVPYRFRARPFDLDQVESTCTTCAVGCRMLVQSTSNRLIRYLGVDADPVNWGWLCDKGRFAYEAVDSDERLRHPLIRRDGNLVETSWHEAIGTVAEGLQAALDAGGPSGVGFLGGARLTNEDAYAWAKLTKGVLGTDNVDAQLDDGLPAELLFALPRATIDDACKAATVVLLGPDLKEELPVLYLRLRQAAIDGAALVELTQRLTGLSPYAATTVLVRPGELEDVVDRLLADHATDDRATDDPELALACRLVRRGPVVVVLGRPSPAEDDTEVTAAAYALADRLPGVTFLPVLRRGNVHGALDMGLSPDWLPGRVRLGDGRQPFRAAWGRVPDSRGLGAGGMLRAAAEGRLGALVLVGCDPFSDFPDRALARDALERVGFLAAVDLFLTDSSSRAQVVLPATGAGEKAGTTTNLEGRVSRLGRKATPPGTARQDWMIAVELADRLGADLGVESLSDIWAEIEQLASAHAGLTPDLLAEPAHRSGLVIPLTPDGLASRPERLPQEAGAVGMGANVIGNPPSISDHWTSVPPGELPTADTQAATTPHAADTAPPVTRRSPETATEEPSTPVQSASGPSPAAEAILRLVSGRKLYDAGVGVRRSPSLAPLAPAPWVGVNPSSLDRLGLHDGDDVMVTNRRGRLEMPVRADPDLAEGSVWVPFNQPGGGAGDLIDAAADFTSVVIGPASRPAR